MHLYLLVLAPVWLEFVDADVRVAGRLLPGAREGRAHALLQWLRLPMWPGCIEGSGARLGIASVGTAPAALHAALPARTRAHGGWSMWMQMFVQPGGSYLRIERAELTLCSSG